jgi:hypothetical protein
LLPQLLCISVRTSPGSRLRHWCSSRYLRISPLHREFHYPLLASRFAVSRPCPELSPDISTSTYESAYARFTPSNSEQRSPPTSYRGCWHVVSRGFLQGYRHNRPPRQHFTIRRPSSCTRRRSVRLSPIAENSSLLPPVGVWAVSQSQCGWSSSQTSYPSLPWWAVTSPTS